jgi:hypothetical protein
MITLTLKAREEIKGLIKGTIVVPDDPGYEEARQVWNAMIDRRPAVIVQCVQADDVPPVIRFARATASPRLTDPIMSAWWRSKDATIQKMFFI